jgi:membrane protein implicated in regulation of membrane protease activity
MSSCRRQAELRAGAHDTEGDRFVLKIVGILVAIAIGLFVLWQLVDMAWYLWGGLAALVFAFLLVFLVVYLLDRRKIKESENLFAS